MKTSYFAYPGIADDPLAVSIARFPPRWWGSRRRCITLAPSLKLFRLAKNGLPFDDYRAEYLKALSHLDPLQIWQDLQDCTLLCFEKDPSQCHRRIVAEWLEKSVSVTIPEL